MSAALDLITQGSRKLNAPMPRPLAKAVDEAAILQAKVPRPDRDAPLGAALDALEAGRDPFTGPTVQRWVVQHTLFESGLSRAADLRSERRVGEALIENADALLSGWAKALAPHARALAAAAEAGVSDLTNTRVLATRAQRDAWAGAATVIDVYAQADNGIGMLAPHRAIGRSSPRAIRPAWLPA